MKLFLFPFLPLSMIFLPAEPGRAAIWTAGHGDLAIGYTGGAQPQFTASWKVGTGGEPGEVDGMEIYDRVFSSTELTPRAGSVPFPSPDALPTGGSLLWMLPQDGTDAAAAGAPFQGWTMTGVPHGRFTGNRIAVALLGVSGPGAVSLWSDGGFGEADFHWTSSNGLGPADRLELGLDGHSHFNLGFSAPGRYRLNLRIQGDLLAGGSVSTPVTLNYLVVPEPGASAFLLLAGWVANATRRRHRIKPE